MHRRDLLRAIARTTGETISTIKRLGFHLEFGRLQKDRCYIQKHPADNRPFEVKANACSPKECADD
jgi:hypothetical protein